MATLKELSERTGYSAATISRVLNADPTFSVPEKVRRKILDEAGKTNYSGTRSGRGRPRKSVLRIGVAEMLAPEKQLDDPYYLYLSNYVKQGCLDRKYTYILLERRGDSFVLSHNERLDGIIAIGLFSVAQIESLSSLTPNVVFVDSSPFESRFDSVVLGYELGISLALEHLFNLNHTKIGFVGPSFKYNDRLQTAPEIRRELFLKLMKARGLYNPEFMIESTMEIDATIKAWKAYLEAGKELPSAVLCANEENAMGTINCLQQEGYSIPEDISVVSFNDTPRSALVTPALTSVSINTREMANTALRMLAERASVNGKTPTRTIPLKVLVPPGIVERASTSEL